MYTDMYDMYTCICIRIHMIYMYANVDMCLHIFIFFFNITTTNSCSQNSHMNLLVQMRCKQTAWPCRVFFDHIR